MTAVYSLHVSYVGILHFKWYDLYAHSSGATFKHVHRLRIVLILTDPFTVIVSELYPYLHCSCEK
jgi:hypothetical protein